MKHLELGIIYFIALLYSSCSTKLDKKNKGVDVTSRPNIILILADDFGIMDTQAYANHFMGVDTSKMYYETPHMDKLIAEGTAFSQAYANPLCSPTRASILTGKYASRLGFTTAMPLRPTYYNQNIAVPDGFYAHDVLEHKDDIKIEQAWINGTSNSAVPTGTVYDNGKDEISITEALKGYHSAFIGKWHIGGFGAHGYQPKDQGFEPLAWADAGGSTYFNWRKGWDNKSKAAFPKMPQEEWEFGNSGKETGETYLTNDLTQQALSYIEERSKIKDQPFFLYFSHFAVHSPYQGIEADIQYFENKATKGWNGHKDPVYAAMIKSMDNSVGAILKKLKDTGIEDNTLVIFMSDNGGIDSKITPKGDGTDNTPFLGGKATLNEGGIRVPLVFRWKSTIKSGQWVDVPVDCTDIYPSILAAAGMDSKVMIRTQDLDGQNLMFLLEDTKNEKKSYTKKEHYWHYPFNVIYNSPYDGYPLTPHSAIRDGDYKLIFDWYGRLYLYDIEKDPYEKTNLVEDIPALKNEMFAKLITWLEKNVEKRYWPTLNENYNPQKEVREIPFKSLIQ
ncbi:sulfatase [Cellulophaga sp. Hel_I_12]|uniref:sulfatase n=1 Tax=Cellulophaga sp. Hel_I_12 TaxID=1249972 RepID=UPI0006911EB5|nr:sulfatase [Cellulophaga sp. Hel_I_12]